MKKSFAIKAVQVSKNTIISAAKSESANLLKFMKPDECCKVMAIQGLSNKLSFSL
ncbi:hypothetical protein HNV11_19510 [Spirosoma taeanense]|uniref:Uncharacterized protein n=1 Tax=Spirosoma taeanense TaxID=2735870 RepID=A0A6M5YB70_9BACT|nr:hypothetical protein [Spirosoma taeanense]QJW91408.1 hypothetical protein HNV11_19510 [Spirosoma taeanense]